MPPIEFKVIPHQTQTGLTYQHLQVRITTPNGIIEPQNLSELELPKDMIWSQGVVIEGKAPIWLYGYLVHECHPAAWVACFDPRLGEASPNSGGAVVVATHSPKVSVGQVLIVNLPDGV